MTRQYVALVEQDLQNAQGDADKEKPEPKEPEPTLEWYLDVAEQTPSYGEEEARADFEEAHRAWKDAA